MTIHPKPIMPGAHRLGGAQFFGRDNLLLTVQADPGQYNETPIEFHACFGCHRTMIDMPIEDAEALIVCLTTAIRLRRAAEGKARVQEVKRTRTFFADPDGQLEAA